MVTLIVVALQTWHVIDISIWWLILTIILDMPILSWERGE